MVAAMAGFVAGVISAWELSPVLGLAAIPIGYTFCMGTKLAVLTAVLQPRIAHMGASSRWTRAIVRDRWGSQIPERRPVSPARVAVMSVAVVALMSGMAFAGTQALGRASLAGPVTTPWAPEHALRSPAYTLPADVATPAPTPDPSQIAVDPAGSPTPPAAATPSPTPGIFAMDLYQARGLRRRAEGHLVRAGRDADLDQHHERQSRRDPRHPAEALRSRRLSGGQLRTAARIRPAGRPACNPSAMASTRWARTRT